MNKFIRNRSRRIYDPNRPITPINLPDSFKQKIMKKIFMCKASDSDFKKIFVICDDIHECVNLYKERCGFYPDVIRLENDSNEEVLIKLPESSED